jgi:hypothetical protein
MKQFRTNSKFVLTRGVQDKRIADGQHIEQVGVIADKLKPGTPYAIWKSIGNKWCCIHAGVAN